MLTSEEYFHIKGHRRERNKTRVQFKKKRKEKRKEKLVLCDSRSSFIKQMEYGVGAVPVSARVPKPLGEGVTIYL